MSSRRLIWVGRAAFRSTDRGAPAAAWRRIVGVAGVVGASVAPAVGQVSSFVIDGASAAGDLGDPMNTVVDGAFSDTHPARSITWHGTLNSAPFPFFFEEDVFASIEGPNGLGYTGPIAGEQGIFLGATPFSGWTAGFQEASVNGPWRFEAYTANDLPTSTNWTIEDAEFAFNSALFPDATPVQIGSNLTTDLTEGEILWYSIDHAGGGLEFSTAGSEIFELDGVIQVDDTLIALFDSTGALVEFNDDAGQGDFTSLLSFDTLASGEYHLAVTGSTFGTRVGESFISTSHDGEGTIRLAVNVPAPSVIGALLVGAGVSLAGRRRNRA